MNMVKCKKILTSIVAAIVSCSICASVTLLSHAAEAPSAITMDKTVFASGDEISVNYSGTSGKDWIAVYPRDAVPDGSIPAIVYQYTESTGNPEGVMDFKNPDRGDITALPAGEYDMLLLEDDTYTIIARIPFSVTAAKPAQPLTMDKSAYTYGESVKLTYTGSTNYDAWFGIYRRGDTPGGSGVTSMIWEYTRNIAQPDGSSDLKGLQGDYKLEQLEEGLYTAYLFKDGGYEVAAKFDFEILPGASSNEPPRAFVYNRESSKRGYADGNVMIAPPVDATGLTGYALYWGNDDGIFDEYTPVRVKSNGGNVTHQLNKNTIIPAGATKLYAYAVYGKKQSDRAVSFSLPYNCASVEEEPLSSFQVISDTHVTTDSGHEHNNNLRLALADILETDPDSIGIFLAGDVTDNGEIAQFEQYNAIINSFENLPFTYCTPGNHDLRGEGGWEAQISKFMKNTNSPEKYYSEEINGATFIMLGSQTSEIFEGPYGNHSNIFEDQQNFLKQELEKASKGSKPIFVFHHQPLYNTVSGSLPGQGWNGVIQDAEIRAILKQYPQAVLFTGHTHWELDAKSPMYIGNGLDATMFNDAAVGYLWTDDDTHLDGSQGYYVEVYANKILVRGRDFKTGKWIANAQFIVDTTLNVNGLAELISEDEEGLIASEAKIADLLSDVNGMSDEQKSGIEKSVEKLTALKEKIDALKKAVSDLESDIESLPSLSDVSLKDRSAVKSARAAYEAMTGEQKKLVTNLSVLTAAEEKIALLESAEPGDLDGDGRLTVSDVVALRKAIMGGEATPELLLLGDMDKDGALSVSDVVALRRKIMLV